MSLATALLLFRHLHFFVLIADLPQAPTLHLQTKQYYTYSDPVRLNLFNAQGDRLVQTAFPVGTTLDRALPAGGTAQTPTLYLAQVDPGMNGAILTSDCPWAVLGSANHMMGVNGPGPQLYFYVPPDCAQFTLGAQSVSPNEGARLTVLDPDGKPAGVLDGELDREETLKMTVPPAARDRLWSLTWAKSETSKAALDDLNFWLDGDLTPLLFPQRDWAEKYGKLLWERDCQGREPAK